MKKVPFILLSIWLIGACSPKPGPVSKDASSKELSLRNGILYDGIEPFTGHLFNKYPSGKKRSEISYVNGRKDGFERQWYEDGSMAVERFYSEGTKIGLHRSWWENGQTKFEYHFNDAGEYNGEVVEWYASGQIYKAFHFVDGKEAGSQRLWREDGRIKANYEVVSGERFGLIGLKKCYTVNENSNEVN